MIGAVYRSKNDIELEGDIDFDGIVIPILNELTSRFDKAEVDFDFPEVYRIGLKYRATDRLVVLVDADLETWSDFSETGIEISTSGPVTKVGELDRNYKDTWHVGVALAYKIDSSSGFATGVSYDSSPVDDNDRTADLPLDEQLKFGMAYVKDSKGKLDYGIGFSLMWFGDGKMDQVAQGERFKGEFESNYVIFAGGSARYEF
jgi:long-chain fatty acid transport protein